MSAAGRSPIQVVLLYWSVISAFTVINIVSISLDKLPLSEQSEIISIESNNSHIDSPPVSEIDEIIDIASNTISNLENDSVRGGADIIKLDSTDILSNFSTKTSENVTTSSEESTSLNFNRETQSKADSKSSSEDLLIKPSLAAGGAAAANINHVESSKITNKTDGRIKVNLPVGGTTNATNNIMDNSGPEGFSLKERRYDGAQVWKILVQSENDRRNADQLLKKYDGQIWKEVKAEVDCLLKSNVLKEAEQHVKTLNLSRIVLIDDLQKIIDEENPSKEEIANLENRNGFRLTWKAYHRLSDINDFFEYLAKTYPELCSLKTIGYSFYDRPLKILKISNGQKGNPAIWIDGGIHAREWISPATVTYVTYKLVDEWDELPANMRNIDWYIHGVVNPDGYEYSHTVDRLWRKSYRPYGRQCRGVDLNRNFGFKWGGKGTSANACSEIYRGNKAFSEPETLAISSFLTQFGKEYFKAYISFHSYGQYILYPWGYDSVKTADNSDLERLAREAATKIARSGGGKYTIGPSASTLYPAAGGSDDWAKGVAEIKYAYTVELGDTGRYGFILPAKYIERNGEDGYTFIETVAKTVAKDVKTNE